MLLILSGLVLITESFIQGTLAVDKKKEMFYSKGAPKNFNQKKYNELCLEVCELMKTYDLATVFYILQLDGSKEALRLKSDLAESVKKLNKDLKKLR